jgi:hypothetical protein
MTFALAFAEAIQVATFAGFFSYLDIQKLHFVLVWAEK